MNNSLPLMPTGTCFDDAYFFLLEAIGDGKEEGIYLCHGIIEPTNTIGGHKIFTHAWLYNERLDLCMQWGMDQDEKIKIVIPKSQFYKMNDESA